MSDLISRSAVIDVLKETGIIQDNDLGHLVVGEIERIPTAYDVDKIVEELEEAKEKTVTPKNVLGHIDYVEGLEKAIEIVKNGVSRSNDGVKGGGVNER